MPPTLSRTHLPQPPAPAGGAASPASILIALPSVCILRARRLEVGRYRAPGMPGAVVRAAAGGCGRSEDLAFPWPSLLCPFWEVYKRGSVKDALGQRALCLGKVKFEVTGKIVSDTPKSAILPFCHHIAFSLSSLGYQTTDKRRNFFLPQLYSSIYLYLFSNILPCCFWRAGVGGEGNCALSPQKLSLRTTELGLQLAQHLLYSRCFMHLYYSLMPSVAL